jgi:hypothetical protein
MWITVTHYGLRAQSSLRTPLVLLRLRGLLLMSAGKPQAGCINDVRILDHTV